MLKKIFLLFVFFSIILSIAAQIPSGYYDGTQGLSGIPLKSKLHDIIDNHTSVSYSSLYTYFQTTDKKPDSSVWDMYSDVPGGTPSYKYYYSNGDECGNYNEEGDCYNREHSFPQSWFNKAMPMKSDLFLVYPTDGYVNNKRSNYPYGEVSSPTWTSSNGSKLGLCSFPGYSGNVFEPIDEYKGDFARTYFYISVRYYNEDSDWQDNAMVDGAQLKPWALNMMKQWSEDDTVSQKEIDRNNAVYQIQNNRNPFIDHPEFIEEIWGSSAIIESKMISLKDINVYPNPVKNYCIIDFKYKSLKYLKKIYVFDITGEKLNIHYYYKNNYINLDTKDLSSGIYLVNIQTNNQCINLKFVK